jgi:hypothetical protein
LGLTPLFIVVVRFSCGAEADHSGLLLGDLG